MHPRLEHNLLKALSKRRDESKVFEDMLLEHWSHGGYFAVRGTRDRDAEELLYLEDSPGIVEHKAVPRISKVCFEAIHVLVECQVVLWCTAEAMGRGFGMVERMSHEDL